MVVPAKMFIRIFFCIFMGAGWGWFASYEWQKTHKTPTSQVAVNTTKTVTVDDIRVVDWRGR